MTFWTLPKVYLESTKGQVGQVLMFCFDFRSREVLIDEYKIPMKIDILKVWKQRGMMFVHK